MSAHPDVRAWDVRAGVCAAASEQLGELSDDDIEWMIAVGTQTGSLLPVHVSLARFAFAGPSGMMERGTQRPRAFVVPLSTQHGGKTTGAAVGPGSQPILQMPVLEPSTGL